MKNRKCVCLQFLIMIILNQNGIFLCLTNDELRDENLISTITINIKGELDSKLSCDHRTLEVKSSPITSTVKKKSRTYKKRKATATSIRSDIENQCDKSVQNGNENKKNKTCKKYKLSSSNTSVKPTTVVFYFTNDQSKSNSHEITTSDEIITQTDHVTSEMSKMFKLQEESGTSDVYVITIGDKTSTRKQFTEKIEHYKVSHKQNRPKPFDKRRQVVFGGQVVSIVKSYTTKFTPKYSPFRFESLHQRVIDLRKTKTIDQNVFKTTSATTRKTKSTPTTLAATTNIYEENLYRLKRLYDEALSEERQLNEKVEENKRRIEMEQKRAEEENQHSYLNKFIVRTVTTESWEKNLPASSKDPHEEYMELMEEKFNQEPIIRKRLEIKKAIILKKIEKEELRLKFIKSREAKVRSAEKVKTEVSYYSDSVHDDDENDKNKVQKGQIRNVKFGKAKGFDEYHERNIHPKKHHVRNNYLQRGTTNSRWTTVFHPNEYCKMMQDGYSQRALIAPSENEKNKKKEEMDIYLPALDTSDEIEREKTYEFTSNQQFVQYLKDNNYTNNERVQEAIHWVDRDRFVKDGYVDAPYNYGTNTIVERPSYQAKCLDYLADNLIPGAKVCDLGFGSGFMASCMSRLVGDSGHVTAIEHIPQLINLLNNKLKITYPKLYKLYRRMEILEWDARKPYKKNAPYDVIHFGSGVTYVPLEYIPDLKINGSILVPVGPPFGPHILKKITLIKKNVYTIQNLAEVEAFHFCSPEEQVYDFRLTYGHHFLKLFSLFYKPIVPYNETVTNYVQIYKLPD